MMQSAQDERLRPPPDRRRCSVIDGYGVGDKDSKACAFELAGEELKQKLVHEHAARERDGIDVFAHADFACDTCRRARDGDMEVECEPVGGRSGFNSSKCLKECFLVQNIGPSSHDGPDAK